MNLRKITLSLIAILLAISSSLYNLPVYADEAEIAETLSETASEEASAESVQTEPAAEIVCIVTETKATGEAGTAEETDEVSEDNTDSVEIAESETKEETVVSEKTDVEEETVSEDGTVQDEETSAEETATEEIVNEDTAEEDDEVLTVSDETDSESVLPETGAVAAEETVAEEETVIGDLADTLEVGQLDWVTNETTNTRSTAIALSDNTKAIVTIDLTKSNDGTGSENYRTFTFTTGEGENAKTYSAYLYGGGIDDSYCASFAYYYLYSKTNEDINVTFTDENFVDADKSSVIYVDENGNYRYYTDNNGETKQYYYYNIGVDSEHCWLKAGSNSLYETGWMNYADAGIFNVDGSAAYYFQSEDDIGDYATYCFDDKPGNEVDFYSWIFTGNAARYNNVLTYGQDDNDALLRKYYQDDIYINYNGFSASNTSIINAALNKLQSGHGSEDLSIYFFKVVDGMFKSSGGHAITLNGVIYDSAGNLSSVVIADPDDLITYGPEDPTEKANKYTLTAVGEKTIDGYPYYFLYKYSNTNPYTFLMQIPYLSNVSDFYNENNELEEQSAAITPEATSAVKTEMTASLYDICENLDIDLNYDFLNFYDIDYLKCDVYDAEGNCLESSRYKYSKEFWQSMTDDDELTFNFNDIIDTYGAGQYNIRLYIDKDCFNGNYGWFAQRYVNADGTIGYYSELADIWAKLYHRSVSTNTVEDEDEEPLQETVAELKTVNRNNEVKETTVVISPTEVEITNPDGSVDRRISSKTDDDVQVLADADVIPTGTTLSHEKLDKESEEFDRIEEAIDKDAQVSRKTISDYFAYDFGLTKKDGSEIHELGDYVEVSLPVPEDVEVGGSQHISTYRVNDDGTLTYCVTDVKNDVITFMTNHFSTYLFVVEDDMPVSGTVIEENTSEETRSSFSPFGAGCIVLAAAVVVAFIIRKKNR